MIKHKHHIIPKHIGGSDEPENIIELTVEEHAEAHRKLWEQHDRWQDYLAWKCLSGHIGKEEAIKFAQKHADKSYFKTEEWKQKFSKIMKGHTPWNKGLTKEKDKRIKDQAELTKKYMKEGKLNNIGDVVRGTSFTEEHKNKLKEKAKNRMKIKCIHCGLEYPPGNYKRWHGEKCKLSDGEDLKSIGTKSRRG